MSVLLRIDTSPFAGEASFSRRLTAEFASQWQQSHPHGRIVNRDLAETDLPPVNAEWIGAAHTPETALAPRKLINSDDAQMQGALMRQFHAETLRVWAQNLDKLSPSRQELGVLNIPIDSRKIPELRERIRKFQDEVIGLVQSESEADCVVQLGTYLIGF